MSKKYRYTVKPEGRWSWAWSIQYSHDDKFWHPVQQDTLDGPIPLRGWKFGRDRAEKRALWEIARLKKEAWKRQDTINRTVTVEVP